MQPSSAHQTKGKKRRKKKKEKKEGKKPFYSLMLLTITLPQKKREQLLLRDKGYSGYWPQILRGSPRARGISKHPWRGTCNLKARRRFIPSSGRNSVLRIHHWWEVVKLNARDRFDKRGVAALKIRGSARPLYCYRSVLDQTRAYTPMCPLGFSAIRPNKCPSNFFVIIPDFWVGTCAVFHCTYSRTSVAHWS